MKKNVNQNSDKKITQNSRSLILALLIVLLIICTLVSISYAWYSVSVNNTVQMATNVNIPSCASVTLNSGGAISLNGDNAAPVSDTKALGSSNYRYSFTVKNACSHTANLKVALAPLQENTMPLSAIKYALVEQGATMPSSGTFMSTLEEKTFSKQIITEIYNSYSINIQKGYELLNTTLNANTTKNYYLYIWIDYYEGDTTQSGLNNGITLNKSFGSHLVISDFGVDDGWGSTPTLSDTVLALGDGTDRTSSQDSSIYRVKHEEVVSGSTTYDAGIRYEGKNPDNYVTFNNEEAGWRIIGTFEGSTIGLESGKYYTKIARALPLDTYYVWDYDGSTYENDWENATLNAYLNGDYLNSLTDTAEGMIAKYNNEYSTWYLKGPTWEQFENAYTPDMYMYERYTGTSGYKNGTAGAAAPEIKRAVALMYPSDYGFAAYGTNCDNRTTDTLYYYESNCGAVDWLMWPDNWEWLISPDADGSNGAFVVGGNGGGCVGYGGVSSEYGARPVLYLSADTMISSGDGSQASPFVLE